MIALNEHYVGFDPSSVGFPSIDGCHAIMARTEQGLFGYHSLGGSQLNRYAPRAAAFAGFMTGHARFGTCLGVYGVCFRGKRGYSSKVEGEGWQQEITAFADAVHFHGAVKGFDLSTTNLKTDSAFVEYRLENGSCNVYYKRWKKMERADVTRAATAENLKYMESMGSNSVIIDAPNLETPIDTVIRTIWNKGEIHQVDADSMNAV